MMWNNYWGNMMGWGFGGWFMMLFFFCVVIALIVWAMRGFHGFHDHGAHGKSALEVLKERYAKGEITKQEFEATKKDLES